MSEILGHGGGVKTASSRLQIFNLAIRSMDEVVDELKNY